MGLLRSSILSAALALALPSFGRAAEVCNYSQITITPAGLGEIGKTQLTKVLQSDSTQKLLKDQVARASINQTTALHKILFGMNVSLKHFSKEVLSTRISLGNASLNRAKFGEVAMHCAEHRCKLHVPIQELSVQGDFKIRCLEAPCAGKDLISIAKLQFSIRPVKELKESAFVEFDVQLALDKTAPETLTLDPKSAKLFISPIASDLSLALTDKEQAAVAARYAESYARRKGELEANTSGQCDSPATVVNSGATQLIRDLDDVRLFASADSLKPMVANIESYAYYAIVKAAIKSEEVSDLQDYLAKTFGPLLANSVNQAFRKTIAAKQPEIELPAVTPSDMFLQPDLNKSKTPREISNIELSGSTQDSEGNLGLQVRSCHPAAANETGTAAPRRNFFKTLKSSGYDIAGAVSIDELNGYLKKVFADAKRNNVYFETKDKQGGKSNFKIHFNEVPQFVTEVNPATGARELYLALDITESNYHFRALKDITVPFLSSTVHGKVGIIFDPKTHELKLKFDRADLGLSSDGPLAFASDLLSNITPIYFLKSALLNGVVLPGLDSKSRFKDLSVEKFSIQELAPSPNGKYLVIAAKISGQ